MHHVAVAAVSADHTMLTHEPDIARASHRLGGWLGDLLLLGLGGAWRPAAA